MALLILTVVAVVICKTPSKKQSSFIGVTRRCHIAVILNIFSFPLQEINTTFSVEQKNRGHVPTDQFYLKKNMGSFTSTR